MVLSKTEYRELFVVFISFLSIDIGWYYFFITMLIIFTLKGTSSDKIGVLTMQAYPNAFKWLVAPIIDTYFISKIGKRTTYLLIISVIHSVILIIVSVHINEWVQEENVNMITLSGFIFNFFGVFKVAA